MAKKQLRPQEGPQEQFLSSPADIAIYGGAAGGGKTFGLLLENIRHVNNGSFGSVIFRRTSKQVGNEGGLWDESCEIFPHLGGVPKESSHEWHFPSGAKVKFSHLEYDKDVNSWDGSQIPLICFDELTHFTKKQFWYLLSRNRSTCGVTPYIRATCNPLAESWVADLIDWWIGEDGVAIKERSGVMRYFIRLSGVIQWGDTKQELVDRFEIPESDIKSLTFIRSDIFDNKILLEKDPSYLANLKAQDNVTKQRLLHGNWKIRATAGTMFRREWFEVKDVAPSAEDAVRYWDRAATEKTEQNDPDFTVGLLMSRDADGVFWIEDVRRFRENPLYVEKAIVNTATNDGHEVRIGIEEDAGQAGKAEAMTHVRNLSGYNVKTYRVTKAKEIRARAFSAQCQAGNVKLVRGDWNEALLTEFENFPDGGHDDIVDGGSGAFNALNEHEDAIIFDIGGL